MSAPATSVVGTAVEISWVAPSTGGLSATGYRVFIRTKAGTFVEETAHCRVLALSCQVPLLTLQASPYLLVLGDPVQAKVRATNAIGDGLDSAATSPGALVETVPASPPVAPVRGTGTHQTQIVVDFYALQGSAIGGTAILSYELQWGVGTAPTSWTVVSGLSSDDLSTQRVVPPAGSGVTLVSGA